MILCVTANLFVADLIQTLTTLKICRIRVADGHLAWEWNPSAGPLSSSPSPRLFSRNVMGADQMMRESQDLCVVSNSGRCFYMAYSRGHQQQQGAQPQGDHHAMISSSSSAAAAAAAAAAAEDHHEDGTASSRRVAEAVAAAAPVVEATVQMPDNSFTSPVALDDWVFLGCRDDHLYCLSLKQ